MGTTPTPDIIPDVTGGQSDRHGAVRDFFEPEVVEEQGDISDSLEGILTKAVDVVNIPIRKDSVFVDPTNILGFGGGTFEGGLTTFGDNIVDTFGEVLNIFPDLRASQISNLLEEFQGLTSSEFARIVNPLDSITSLSSAGGDPDQILRNSSGDFSGLTPEQISQLLTGGNINNF